jgi:hypothetical protein
LPCSSGAIIRRYRNSAFETRFRRLSAQILHGNP